MKSGCKVISIGECTSPMLYFNAWHRKIDGAIITASHNPAEYTGFKFTDSHGCSYVDEYEGIKELYKTGKFLEGDGKIKEADGYRPYLEFFKSVIRLKKKIKVVVDCLYASGGTIIPKLYEDMGLEVVALHAKPKKDFNNERPEPKGENLKKMSRAILEENADFGV